MEGVSRLFIKVLFSFFVSAGTSVLNNIEKRYIVLCGLCGSLTAFLYDVSENFVSPVMASLISCFLLATVCQYLSFKTKRPDTSFIIPGIMPVVPGSLVFRAFDALAESSYMKALDYGTQAIMVGVSIALALVFNETMTTLFMNIKHKAIK